MMEYSVTMSFCILFFLQQRLSLSRSIVVYYVFWQRFIHCAIRNVFYVLLLLFPLQITCRNARSSRLSAKGINRLLCGSSCYSINLTRLFYHMPISTTWVIPRDESTRKYPYWPCGWPLQSKYIKALTYFHFIYIYTS